MGSLGSIVASRIAREFHLGGPSFTISSEESSGLRALEIAVRCPAARRDRPGRRRRRRSGRRRPGRARRPPAPTLLRLRPRLSLRRRCRRPAARRGGGRRRPQAPGRRRARRRHHPRCHPWHRRRRRRPPDVRPPTRLPSAAATMRPASIPPRSPTSRRTAAATLPRTTRKRRPSPRSSAHTQGRTPWYWAASRPTSATPALRPASPRSSKRACALTSKSCRRCAILHKSGPNYRRNPVASSCRAAPQYWLRDRAAGPRRAGRQRPRRGRQLRPRRPRSLGTGCLRRSTGPSAPARPAHRGAVRDRGPRRRRADRRPGPLTRPAGDAAGRLAGSPGPQLVREGSTRPRAALMRWRWWRATGRSWSNRSTSS